MNFQDKFSFYYKKGFLYKSLSSWTIYQGKKPHKLLNIMNVFFFPFEMNLYFKNYFPFRVSLQFPRTELKSGLLNGN